MRYFNKEILYCKKNERFMDNIIFLSTAKSNFVEMTIYILCDH